MQAHVTVPQVLIEVIIFFLAGNCFTYVLNKQIAKINESVICTKWGLMVVQMLPLGWKGDSILMVSTIIIKVIVPSCTIAWPALALNLLTSFIARLQMKTFPMWHYIQ